MRLRALFIIVAIGGLLATAHAEKVKTNQSAKLFARPGEQAKVVLKVKSGQGMTVLAKEGRWIKVRVQGRTGFVPRSKVDMPDDDEIVRNTRRRPFVDGRSTKRGFGGDEGPDDRVGADATGDGSEPEPKTKAHDDADKPPKKPAKSHDSDDDEDTKKPPKKPAKSKSKGGDDDDATVTDDDADSDKTKSDDPSEDKADERPMAHVSSKTKVFSERNEDSEAQFTARPADVLFPTDTKGKWTMVENEEGDAGWVMTSMLDTDEGGGGKRKPIIELRGRVGASLLTQGMRTAGGTATLDNYNLGTSAVVLAIGGSVLFPYGKSLLVGGELAYDLNKAAPGIFYDPDGMMGPLPGVNIGVTVHNLNLRLLGGYDLHKKNGMTVFGRLGYHNQSFQVTDYTDFTKNLAKLPNEKYSAPTIGAALWIPKLTDKIGIRASLDAALFGSSVSQTKNLEDGASPTAKGICLGGMFSYVLQKAMSLQATYDLNYASYSFGAPVAGSMRGHTGTAVTRTDIFHTIAVGIAYGF